MSDQTKITDDVLYAAFSKDEVDNIKKEAREKYGKQAVEEGEAKLKKLSKEEFTKLMAEDEEITRCIGENMDKGIESDDVQSLIDRHYGHLNFFGHYSYGMYANLGRMYVDDPRFTAYYEKYRPGLAEFIAEAMFFYANNKQKTSEK